jgi:uncharacterized protein YndB with AHSA1/START domain
MTTPPAETLNLEVRIQARPETVFAYFTDAEKYRRWQGRAAELDPRPGGLYRVQMVTGAFVRGEYQVVDPPRRLVFTWGWEGDPDMPPGSTTVEVQFIPDGETTIVRLRHGGLPTGAAHTMHAEGWTRYLDRLALAALGSDPGPEA